MKRIIILLMITLAITACNQTPVEKEIIYVPVKDTISDEANIIKIINLERELQITKDSLNYLRDSLGEDLFVAKYKLSRIKYYTDIVDKKPSQLKYYKGWIKRALKE